MEEDADLRHLSCGLYEIVTHGIGSEETIRVRRIMGHIGDELKEINSNGSSHVKQLRSGSMAEGFNFRTSDLDVMVVYMGIKVITDDVRFQPVSNQNEIILKMETDKTRPGFSLLRLLLPQDHRIDCDECFNKFCVNYQNGRYLSNIIWKEETKSYIQDPIIHGPCESGIHGDTETDVAHCLRCSKWPTSTYPCLQRLARRGWPSLKVLSRIIENGCHVVPIGDKASDKEEIEWRLSFSEAEKTLIHEMNHCQFLTYGLLKIFLKEAINTRQDVGDLLCSYFLKTAVLWEIVNSDRAWIKHDFLKWFWICFRRLISWVSNGFCPNFFIPENNMFLGKILGRSQQVLLRHLMSFHRMGYKCFIACASLFRPFLPLLGNYIVADNSETCPFYSDSSNLTNMEIIRLILKMYDVYPDISSISNVIRFFQHILTHNETSDSHVITCIGILLQHHYQQLVYHYAIEFTCTSPAFVSRNKIKYGLNVKCINTLKQTKYSKSSHAFLTAIILYKQGMYHHVIRKVKHIREQILDPHVMYAWRLDHLQLHKVVRGGRTVDVIIRKFIINELNFLNNACLPELCSEHSSTFHSISYPPFVLLHFLLFMSYHHLFMFSEARFELENLIALMNVDDGHYVNEKHRAISWEMLGICQEIAGCFQDAYLSYQNALKEQFNNNFREVTLIRIQNLATYMNHI